MQPSIARLALLSWLLAALPAAGDELSDFNAAVEKAASHQRVALGYLRTGNTDLAALEVERMREAWGAVTVLKRPGAFDRDPELYSTTLVDVSLRMVSATIMIDTFRPDIARDSLIAVRQRLSALRKAGGISVLADCIGEANAIMDRLMIFDDAALDWNRPGIGGAVAQAATDYGREVARCDGIASADIRAVPEFRRLIDGVNNSLAQIPRAIAERDGNLLHRLLIELRSFDNLLAFRYG